MRKHYSFLLVFLLYFSASFGQVCPYAGYQPNQSWTWPTHSKWFFGGAESGANAVLADFSSGTAAFSVISATDTYSYEGTTSPADESGNLLFFTNGQRIWDGAGTLNATRLSTGNEDTRNNGSAVQGVLAVKHPLNPDVTHIFCADDVLSAGNLGLDHYTVDPQGNILSGPTTILAGRTFEGLNATWHTNGVDVWIMAQSYPSGDYQAFLLSCTGLAATPVVSDVGIEFYNNGGVAQLNWARGSLEFSSDGGTLAQGHPATWPWGDQEISTMTFNQTTGVVSNPVHFSSVLDTKEMYDIEFSPDNSKLYFANKFGEFGYFDLNAGGAAAISATRTIVADLGASGADEASIEMGGDGRMYINNVTQNDLHVATGSLNAGATGTSAIAMPAGTVLSVTLGLPNMFLPPRDWVQIVDPGALTECDLPYNFSTNWLCKGTDAENTVNYENAYAVLSGPAGSSIDPITGVFNATSTGTYEITFSICEIKDTLQFTVGTCGCQADVKPGPLAVCEGTNIMVDSLLNASSGAGVWTIDSVPTGAGSAATITDDGVDTTFNAPIGTIPGIYKVMFEVTGGMCKDSIYIRVNQTPVVTVNSEAICAGDAAETFTCTTDSAAGSYLWSVNGTGTAVTTTGTTAGNYTVQFTDANGCIASGTGVLTVNALPVVTVNSEAICAGDPAATFTATSDKTEASHLWSDQGSGTAVTTTGTTAGNYVVQVTDNDGCIGSGTGVLTVNAVPVVTVNSVAICAGDPAATFTATSDKTAASHLWSDQGSGTAGTASGTTAGNYIVQVTDNDGCVASGIGVLTVHTLPTVSVNDEVICSGDPAATFTATTTATVNGYLWSGQGTGIAAITTGTTAGTYTVVITDNNGCTATDDGTLTVNVTPTAAVTAMGPYCANEAAVAMAGTPVGGTVVGTWKINSVVSAGGSFDPSLAVVGDNIVRYIANDGGCIDSTDITVVVNAVKDATLSEQTITACVFDPNPTLTVAEAGGTWDNAAITMNGTTATIDLATLGTVTNLVLTYTLAAPCGDMDQVTISTTSALDATITQVGPYCQSNTNDVTLQAFDAGGTWSGTGITDAANGTFNPNTAGPGTHTITYAIPGNCGDTKTIDIVVDEQPDATISGEVNLCINAAAITLTVPNNPVGTIGTWTETPSTNGGFNNTSLEFDPANVATTAGTYVLDYSLVNGECNATDQATIVVVDTPQFTIVPVGPFCSTNAAVPLSITPDIYPGGTWSSPEGGVVGANFDPTVASTAATNVITYVASVTSDGQTCSATQTTDVTVEEQATTTMPVDFGLCSSALPSSVVALTSTPASAVGTYTATCGTCYNSTTNVFDPASAGAGPHTITYSVGAACAASDEIIITVTEAAVITPVSPANVCLGEVPDLFTATVGGATGSGVWSLQTPVPGATITAAGQLDVSNMVSGGTVTATYTYTTSPDNCVSFASTAIEVFDNPVVDFSRSNQDSCVAYIDAFTDNTVYAQSSLVASTWDFGNGQTATDQGTASSAYTVAGQYTVTLSNVYANGCKDTESIQIEVFPLPNADFIWSPAVPTTLDPKVLFINASQSDPNAVDVGYEWDFTSKGLPSTSIATGPNVAFTVNGDDTIPVSLVVTDNFLTTQGANVSCTDTAVKNVIIEDIFQFYVPNAFTPGSGSDGLNDTFYPVGKNWSTDDYEFVILDRWGNLIFKTTNIGDAWDGTVDGSFSSGKLAQNDVYIWKITVGNVYTGKLHKKVGTVTLVR